jgi:hypothetical protein
MRTKLGGASLERVHDCRHRFAVPLEEAGEHLRLLRISSLSAIRVSRRVRKLS